MFADWVMLELTSADCMGNMRQLSDKGVEIRNIRVVGELTVRFQLRWHDLKLVRGFCEKKGLKLETLGRTGFLHRISPVFSRPVLLVGLVIMFLLCIYIPEHILFVTVEGNSAIPANQILEAAEECGVRLGVSRRSIRNETLKNQLLSRIPELQWAGINTYGSMAVITVRERQNTPEINELQGYTNIVAERDGVVLSCTITRGTGKISLGQAVKKGDILVSGISDYGISRVTGPAEGEILATTFREIVAITPDFRWQRTETTPQETRFSIRIGKKRINLYKCSGILGGSCVKMKLEYVLTLPGGLTLPFVLIRETVSDSVIRHESLGEDGMAAELTAFARNYLQTSMIAGQIVSASESCRGDAGIRLTGVYNCQEMIGRVRHEEIGVYDETD